MVRGLRTTAIIAVTLLSNAFFGNCVVAAGEEKATPVYDEGAYTQYVRDTMQKLDKLYLKFCGECTAAEAGSGAEKEKARREYAKTARELMQYMNARFDKLDPKKGDTLSPAEMLVDIHALTMMVDILTETYLERVAEHPYQ